jgi:hypothetical protein
MLSGLIAPEQGASTMISQYFVTAADGIVDNESVSQMRRR